MEQINKIILTIILSSFSLNAFSLDLVPDDILLTEALKSLHSTMADQEKKCRDQVTLIEGEQITTKSFATKYNNTRLMLNKKLEDIGSWVNLASRVMSITVQSKNLYDNFTDFTKMALDSAQKNPFVLIFYGNAVDQAKEEVDLLLKQVAYFVGYQSNVLKATMDEKNELLSKISYRINRTTAIINRGKRVCRSLLKGGVKEYHFREFLKNKNNTERVNRILDKWNRYASGKSA